MERRSARRLAWIVALAVVATAAAIAFFEVGRYMDHQKRVHTTLALRDDVEKGLSSLKDIETGTRGYLLTGDPSFLTPFDAGRQALPAELARVVDGARGDEEQAASARRFQALAEEKLAGAERQIANRAEIAESVQGGLPDAVARGKLVMDEARIEASTMTSRLHTELVAQQAEVSRAAERAGIALALGFVFALLIAVGGILSSRREMAEAAEMNDCLRGQTTMLADAERRWRILSEASFEGVAVSRDGVILDANENLARWLGCGAEELIGRAGIDLFAPEDREHVDQMSRSEADVYEAHLLGKDGARLAVEVRARTAAFGAERLRIGVLRDITERRQREADAAVRAEELRTLSLKDELSGLYNRRGFLELTQHAMRGANRSARKCSVFYIDLNDMKRVNDLFGHEAGDNALRATSALLTEVFRASDVVARLGGDEFAVFAPDCDDDGVLATKARLASTLARRNARSTAPYEISLSVGAATYDPVQPVALQALLDQADARMYEDKRGRKAERKAAGEREAGVRSSQQHLRLVR